MMVEVFFAPRPFGWRRHIWCTVVIDITGPSGVPSHRMVVWMPSGRRCWGFWVLQRCCVVLNNGLVEMILSLEFLFRLGFFFLLELLFRVGFFLSPPSPSSARPCLLARGCRVMFLLPE